MPLLASGGRGSQTELRGRSEALFATRNSVVSEKQSLNPGRDEIRHALLAKNPLQSRSQLGILGESALDPPKVGLGSSEDRSWILPKSVLDPRRIGPGPSENQSWTLGKSVLDPPKVGLGSSENLSWILGNFFSLGPSEGRSWILGKSVLAPERVGLGACQSQSEIVKKSVLDPARASPTS